MNTYSLDSLALQLKQAIQPIILNESFIKKAGIIPPDQFDEMLKAGFRLEESLSGLSIRFSVNDVGEVSENQLTVKNVSLSFLGGDIANQNSYITFKLNEQDGKLSVRIETNLRNWTFTEVFPDMTSWPFHKMVFSNPTFIFTTVNDTYTYENQDFSLLAGQNYAANLTVPDDFTLVFGLIEGLGVIPSSVPIVGPIVLNKVNNKNIFYPDMNLLAPISKKKVKVFFMEAYNPSIGLKIETVEVKQEEDESDKETYDEEISYEQKVSLYFGLKYDLKDSNDQIITMDLNAYLINQGTLFNFSLIPDAKSNTQLTPDTVMELMLGESYFQYVPSVLQQYFAAIGFQGMSLSGFLPPKKSLTTVAISMGSVQNKPFLIFSDGRNNQNFSIESFTMDWFLTNPLDSKIRAIMFEISAKLTLWPEVFRKKNGLPGGVFDISIDSDLHIVGGFAGKVSFLDLVEKITLGFIQLPNGVQVDFSDITLDLDFKGKSYGFSCTLDAAVDFITFGGKPLISIRGMQFALNALLPSESESKKTVYSGSIDGYIAIGSIAAYVNVNYDGNAKIPTWLLGASLAAPLPLSDLLNQFFRAINLPDFLPGDLMINSFKISASIPTEQASGSSQIAGSSQVSGSSQPSGSLQIAGSSQASGSSQSSYEIDGSLNWKFELANQQIDTTASLSLKYDGNKPAGQCFSGTATGSIDLEAIHMPVTIGYDFGSAPDTKQISNEQQKLWITWEGINATYDFQDETITFTLKGWSVGKLLQSLVSMIGDPYFTLESPWDFLNKISLDGLKLLIDLKSDAVNPISAEYELSSPIDFGFVKINGLQFKRVEGQVTLSIDGSSSIPGLKDTPLFDKTKGQDVKNMPGVPGNGNQWFDLRLLMLGQRIGINGYESFNSIKDAVTALEKVPSSNGKSNPIASGSAAIGQPFYDQSRNWLIAGDFGLLKVGNVYTVDCMFVFDDPDLYGLRLGINGEKAKVLAGLAIDIMYKKITDDVGLYQIDFSLPNSIRNLDFGAFQVTLPNIGIKIYTNGDFLFDFGFPYNLDFSRSFTVQAIIAGVPVLGSGGFYFGKLSSATATNLPTTTKGIFNPVIVFGLGVQLGVGYYIDKGIFKAGFSITVFGIVEGTIAAWHPYSDSSELKTNAVQGDYYFKLAGTFGIIGKLYGTVDFCIIKASVNLTVTLAAKITYESFRAIELQASASVSVSVSIKIDLGLFSIKINFSFATTISCQMTIGSNSKAPWDNDTIFASNDALFYIPLHPNFRSMKYFANEVKPILNLHPIFQFTVLASENTQMHSNEGAFVFLLVMDAPTAGTVGNNNNNPTSFDLLCENLFYWLIDAYLNTNMDISVCDIENNNIVSKAQLEQIIKTFSDTTNPPIPASKIMEFLQSTFDINVTPVTIENQEDMKANLQSAVIFPPFTGFSITVPDRSGCEGTKTINFGNYTQVSNSYRTDINHLFDQLAAQVEAESKNTLRNAVMEEDSTQSFMQTVFEDYFLTISRKLIQDAVTAMEDFTYPLKQGDSLQSILDWAKERGNTIKLSDIVIPNLEHPLTSQITLLLQGISYAVQKGDSLNSIAARYTDNNTPSRYQVTPLKIMQVNSQLATLLLPNITLIITKEGQPYSYMTQQGDSFNTVAKELNVSLEELAAQASVCDMENLLAPTIRIQISDIKYITSSGNENLHQIIAFFGMSLEQFLSTPSNSMVQNFFDTKNESTIQIANLEKLYSSDLWNVIQASDQISQTAGMVSRYQLHGMRMPKEQGLILSDNFLYSGGQQEYGLYQLTGQQFPVPSMDNVQIYSVTLSKDACLDWIEFDGDFNTDTLEIDLTQQANHMKIVLDYLNTNGYDPNPTLSALSDVVVNAKRYTMQSYTLWSTSDINRITNITTPGDLTQDVSSLKEIHVQPIIWNMPDSLIQYIQAQQKTLSEEFNFGEYKKYMPVLVPEAGTNDPATRTTTFERVTQYTFATRINFQVKMLAKCNYELIGPGPADAMLLQQILTAMDSEGENMVSGLFILYQNDITGSELVSCGNDEFLSFITQTNLSTETNPPQMDEFEFFVKNTILNGILNKSNEFLKLMWEVSTVHSGGYYFYYRSLDSDRGLPDSLFNESGVANLSLVITYCRESVTTPDPIFNFVNALITTQHFDMDRTIMTLASQSSPNLSMPLKTEDSLNQLAALYGMGIGELVNLNKNMALAENTEIPISGVYHQITLGDSSIGTLKGIAAYYSDGAKVPITVSDIINYNPGVQLELYSVYRIPPFTYVVKGSSGVGNTFDSISKYYGISLDALAYNTQNINGLFQDNTQLQVDMLTYDVYPSLGLGNVGIELTRMNYGNPDELSPNPTDDEKEDYAQKYLASLYSLMSAGLYKNVFFNSSMFGIPFGPTKSLNSEEAVAIRRLKARFAETDDIQQEYSQVLGFTSFSAINPVYNPNSCLTGIPDRSNNPYIGVGSIAQICMRFMDIFGNLVNTPFVTPEKDYTGPLNNIPVPIDYVDSLIGLDRWPNVRSYYTYSGTAGQPMLEITIKLDTNSYQIQTTQETSQHAQTIENDLKVFTRIYYQLHQDYTSENIAGLSGNAVSMMLTNSLFASPETELSEELAGFVREFVVNCLNYISLCIKGQCENEQPICTIKIPVDPNEVSTNHIIPLAVSLTFKRQAELCDPSIRGNNTGGISVTSFIPALTDDIASAGEDKETEKKQVSVKVFATALEKAFVQDNWKLVTGVGIAEPNEMYSNRSYSLWAVRMSTARGGQGLGFQIGSNASFYAPKPIATELHNDTVEINTYTTGKSYPDGDSVEMSFTGSDLDRLMRNFLNAVDKFLSAEYMVPAFILDRNIGIQNPEKDGYLAKILAHKQTLADAISSTVMPILSTSQTDDKTRKAAKDKMYQQLLKELGCAYAATTVVVYPVSEASYDKPLNQGIVEPPKFYGQPICKTSDNSSLKQNYSISTGKIPLTPNTGDGMSCLAFLFTSKNVKQQPYMNLDLSYAITHLEHSIQEVSGISNYRQSSWLSFVNGPITVPLGTKEGNLIPVILRELPTPPTLTAQTANKIVNQTANEIVAQTANKITDQLTTTPNDLAKWSYNFTYQCPQASQDSVTVAVEFNLKNDFNNIFMLETKKGLFQALVQFESVYPNISKDLDNYLKKVADDIPNTQSDTNLMNAQYAVEALEYIINNVTEAYTSWSSPINGMKEYYELTNVKYVFDVRVSPDGNDARIDIMDQSIIPPDFKLPDPIVLIDQERYEAVKVTSSQGVRASYKYKKKEEQVGSDDVDVYLSYQDIQNISERTISFEPLDIFAFQNSWSSIQIIRNKYIIPGTNTTDVFQFRTPQVKFSDSIIPLLKYKSFDMKVLSSEPADLLTYLTAFFKSLFADAPNEEVVVKMESTFSYSFASNIKELPRIELPVKMLAPTPYTIDSVTQPEFVSALSKAVESWKTNQTPLCNESAQFNFSLELFAGNNSLKQMQLFTLDNLFITMQDLK